VPESGKGRGYRGSMAGVIRRRKEKVVCRTRKKSALPPAGEWGTGKKRITRKKGRKIPKKKKNFGQITQFQERGGGVIFPDSECEEKGKDGGARDSRKQRRRSIGRMRKVSGCFFPWGEKRGRKEERKKQRKSRTEPVCPVTASIAETKTLGIERRRKKSKARLRWGS